MQQPVAVVEVVPAQPEPAPEPKPPAQPRRRSRLEKVVEAGWTRRIVLAVLLTVYAGLVVAVLAQSIRDPTPGPVDIADDRYFDRHAEVVMLGATGALLFALIVLLSRGGTVSQRIEAHRVALGLTVLLTGFGVALAVLWERKGLEGAAMVGIIVLGSSLLGGSILSRKTSLGIPEVRTAITLSTVAMFFALVGFAPDLAGVSGGVLAQAVEHFWLVVATVVGFYFGGHTLETLRRPKDARDAS